MLYGALFNEGRQYGGHTSSPFSDDNYDFQNEAVMHLSHFGRIFILLLLARFMVSSIVKGSSTSCDPGEKMNRRILNNLEKD